MFKNFVPTLCPKQWNNKQQHPDSLGWSSLHILNDFLPAWWGWSLVQVWSWAPWQLSRRTYHLHPYPWCTWLEGLGLLFQSIPRGISSLGPKIGDKMRERSTRIQCLPIIFRDSNPILKNGRIRVTFAWFVRPWGLKFNADRIYELENVLF